MTEHRPSYLLAISSSSQMYSGIGRVLFDWVRFASPYYEFSMLMDLVEPQNFRLTREFCQAHGVRLYTSPSARRPGAPDFGLGRAAEVIQSRRWDYIEIVSWASAASTLDVLAARDPNTKLVYTPHTQPLDTLPNPDAHFLVEPAFDAAICAADLVCCVSEAERRQLAVAYPRQDCFRYVPNGVDGEVFRPDRTPRSNAVLSVFDARESRKRLDLLLAGFAAAAAAEPELTLDLVGRGSDKVSPPSSIAHRVRRRGYVPADELIRLYRSARVMVLLSDFEAFGLPIAEALMCGTPVVATCRPQQASLFGDLPGVELVDNVNVDAIRAAIGRAGRGIHPSEIAAAAYNRFALEHSCGRKLTALRALVWRDQTPSPQGQRAPHAGSAPSARPEPETAPPRPLGAPLARPRGDGALRVLHVTPGYFADASLIGGGERYVENVCKAVHTASEARSGAVECSVMSFGPVGARLRSAAGTAYDVLAGRPEAPASLDIAALDQLLAGADIVHVHQCLSNAGMFLAGHARLLGRRVIGSDHGGGNMETLIQHPQLIGIYDLIQTFSAFGGIAMLDFGVTQRCIFGPVDDDYFTPGPTHGRDPGLLLAVGRILPHKGLEAVIDALPAGLTLVIAGRPYDPEFRRALEVRATGKRVIFEEGLDDAGLLSLMRRAGLCVNFSTHFGLDGRFYYKPELLGLAPLECMSTGATVVVSRAGSLRELDSLPGCHAVGTSAELADLLERWASGSLPVPPEGEIRGSVVERYGLRQFGRHYIDMVRGL